MDRVDVCFEENSYRGSCLTKDQTERIEGIMRGYPTEYSYAYDCVYLPGDDVKSCHYNVGLEVDDLGQLVRMFEGGAVLTYDDGFVLIVVGAEA